MRYEKVKTMMRSIAGVMLPLVTIPLGERERKQEGAERDTESRCRIDSFS